MCVLLYSRDSNRQLRVKGPKGNCVNEIIIQIVDIQQLIISASLFLMFKLLATWTLVSSFFSLI